MDRTLALVAFVSQCVCCIMLLIVLGIVVFAQRKGATVPPRLKAFYALGALGAFLGTLAAYWDAFGRPTHRQTLHDIVQVGGLCVYGAAFWIARVPIRQTMSRFVEANGGTAGSALSSALRHPGLSLTRLGSPKQAAADTEPPAA